MGDPPDEGTAAGGNLDQASEVSAAAPLAASTCPGSTLPGIDVSYYQGTINWPKVAAAGYAFAFVRVSDGVGYRDNKFTANWSGAKAAGLVRGAYQFFRPGQDAIAQADLLADAVGSIGPGDLPPVIDVEDAGGLARSTVAARVGTCVARIRARLGVDPIVYTGSYFWDDNVGSSSFANLPLWIAQYTSAACPRLPSAWSSWTFWQYSDSGSVPGIAGGVDVNRFNGTRADLERLAGSGGVPIEVYWGRRPDGGYDLRAIAPDAITNVGYFVDGYPIGSATRADGSNFPTSYQFSNDGLGRTFEVRGYDADGKQKGVGVGSIDVTEGTAVYIRELGDHLYEMGLERAPSQVAAIEVRLDGFLLTDSVTGKSHSTRLGVRSSLQQLGSRTMVITTYNSDGTVRGTLTRTFSFR